MAEPIKLYSWPTPNSWKISIFLEEAGLPYEVVDINIGAGEQFTPEFLKISPNNKMPAILDPDGPGGQPYTVFESGAILMYLADKTGQFWPREPRARWDVVQWLMFQMASVGPMFGQAHHFRAYAPEKLPYAIERYNNEQRRIYGVIDRRLGESAYLAGPDYTIADMAVLPWTRGWKTQEITLEEFPHFRRWFETLCARPAVIRGFDLQKDKRRQGQHTDKEREILFGSAQYQRR